MLSLFCKFYSNSFALLILLFVVFFSSQILAKGDLTKQMAVTISVMLGDKNNALKFYPDNIEFESGKLYRLILKNQGLEKHYFSSDKFSQSVFTRKIQTIDEAGKTMAEVKGHVREIEVYPGHTAEWWFVPIKTGSFDDLQCVIPGHAAAGMVGIITIY